MGKKLVDPNKLCMGCMEILEMPQEPCPHCGFYLPTYSRVRNSLPPYEILNGKYLVGKVIGVGGFGITYIGWDFYQSRRVCIKEYFPRGVASRGEDGETSMSTYSTSMQYSLNVLTQNTQQARNAYLGGLQTYLKEAENLSRFYAMPGIVSVRDFFYGNKTAYIVMEYIQGINLKQYAKQQGGRLSPQVLFPMLKEVIAALNAVHKENIIHRDISPDNIMISRDGKAKVIDFGAAKDYHSARDTSILLKHGYAPIEQYDRNGKQGPWTDVYSLCASIYYLLTGVKLQRSYERVAEDKLQYMQTLGVPVTEQQDRAIRKGLNVQIEERYQTMADFYYDLYGECLPGEKPPVEVQEPEKAQEPENVREPEKVTAATSEFQWEEKTVKPISMSAAEAAQRYLQQHIDS